MGDANDSCTLELLIDQLLDSLFGDYVNVGGSFIKNDDAVGAEDSSDDADELTLTNTQVLSFLLDLEFKAFAILIVLFLVLFALLSGFCG